MWLNTDLARLALFDYRAYYMTLFNTTTRYAELWRRGMTLASRAVRPGFDTHRKLRGNGLFLLLQCFVFFCSLFTTMANISIFLSPWHSHKNFKSQFSQFMRCSKDCNAFKNWWYLFIVLLREITQNTTDRSIANFSVLLLFFEKVPG